MSRQEVEREEFRGLAPALEPRRDDLSRCDVGYREADDVGYLHGARVGLRQFERSGLPKTRRLFLQAAFDEALKTNSEYDESEGTTIP